MEKMTINEGYIYEGSTKTATTRRLVLSINDNIVSYEVVANPPTYKELTVSLPTFKKWAQKRLRKSKRFA